MTWLGLPWQGSVSRGLAGPARLDAVCLGVSWLGRRGVARHASRRHDTTRLGMAGKARHGAVSPGVPSNGAAGAARFASVALGVASPAFARQPCSGKPSLVPLGSGGVSHGRNGRGVGEFALVQPLTTSHYQHKERT